MKKIHVFTSAACNYIPKVRVLIASIRQHHPDWVIHLALADEIPDDLDLSGEPFDEIHPVNSLNIPSHEGWAFCHTIVELATAIKPFLLAKLLERDDCRGVVYLDPDTVVFSPLEEVERALEVSNIALTPHQITPETSLSAIMDNEIASLKHGIYNLGFVAVAPTPVGRAFAQWWSSRVYHFCRAEIHNGLFTDQRWIDLVPAFFEGVCILRSARLNVAPWNITTRQISGSRETGVFVNGEALGFYHFTGFDSGDHRIMARKNAAGSEAVHELIEWYHKTIAELGKDPLSARPWAFATFQDGTPIPKSARLIYRERLDLQSAFPDPFSAEGNSYKQWFFSQGKVEYPKLFDPEFEKAEMLRLTYILTPGFQNGGADLTLDFAKLSSKIWRLLNERGSFVNSLNRGLEIVRTEGVKGITRRLQ